MGDLPQIRVIPICRSLLLAGKKHCEAASFYLRGLIDCSTVLERVSEIRKDMRALLHVSHLASAETKCHLHAVALGEELPCSIDLGLEIVGIDVRGHTDLLDLHSVLLLLGVFLFSGLLILILAVIDDLAYRRLCSWRDLNQIEISFFSQFSCFRRRHDAQHLAFGADHSNFSVTDLFIDE